MVGWLLKTQDPEITNKGIETSHENERLVCEEDEKKKIKEI